METLTVSQFLQKGYASWAEAHWSFCGTEEQALTWLRDKGFSVKDVYAMTYGKGIFGYWAVVEGKVNEDD